MDGTQRSAAPAGAGDDDLLDVAVEAARAGGAVLLECFGGLRTITAKSTPTDLVSDADHRAEQAIVDVLARRRPGDAFLGEERGHIPGSTGLRWVVDPLDGTVNFLSGLPVWSVSVACEGLAGVVLDPLRDELFAARSGQPPSLGGAPLRPSACRDLSGAVVATGFAYEADVRARQAEVLARVLPRVANLRRLGSAALDMAWTAAGRYDAYFERGVNPWDIAAGTLVCEAAGLEVHELPAGDGVPMGICVAPPALAGPLLELVS